MRKQNNKGTINKCNLTGLICFFRTKYGFLLSMNGFPDNCNSLTIAKRTRTHVFIIKGLVLDLPIDLYLVVHRIEPYDAIEGLQGTVLPRLYSGTIGSVIWLRTVWEISVSYISFIWDEMPR